MLHVLNFTGHRDKKLADLMRAGVEKFGYRFSQTFTEIWCDDTEWGNGAGWEASMMKVRILRNFSHIADSSYLLSVDSDVLFFTPDLFNYVEETKPEICGLMNEITVETLIGPMRHLSGCLTFIRGDVMKRINSITDEELLEVRKQFKQIDLCENEDVVVSYLAKKVGAEFRNLPHEYRNGSIEEDLISGNLKSMYHVNYMPTQFLGEPVTGKWDIPDVLKLKWFV